MMIMWDDEVDDDSVLDVGVGASDDIISVGDGNNPRVAIFSLSSPRQ